MRLLFALSFFVLLAAQNLNAQCTISAKREVCLNDLVAFNLNSSGTVTSYTWDFGTFGTSSNTSPLIKFTSTGNVLVSCTATLSGGQQCIDTHNLVVLPLPKAKFSISTESKLCVHENYVCLIDSNQKAAKGIAKVSIVWGDGNLSQFTPPLAKTWCHSFTDTGWHNLNMEIEDSAGCKDNFDSDVHLHPSILHDLPFTEVKMCDSVELCLHNNVSGGKSITSSWYTVPGGQLTNINTPYCKVLQAAETLNLKLISVNEFGCKDSTNFSYSVPKSPFYLLKLADGVCINELLNGAHMFSSGEDVQWYMNDIQQGIDIRFVVNTDAVLGMNYVKIVRIGGCSGVLHDSFEVIGIRAAARAYNDTRLKLIDTAFFVDHTSPKKGVITSRLWDFGDGYAAQCTTWTAKGINVGKNCNYSRDSIAKHYYNISDCYSTRLIIEDSSTGCFDDTAMPVYRRYACEEFDPPKTVCIDDKNVYSMPKNWYKKSGDKNALVKDIDYPDDTVVMYGGYAFFAYHKLGFKTLIIKHYADEDTVWKQVGNAIVVDSIRPALGWLRDTFPDKVEVLRKSNAKVNIVKISDCNPAKVRITFSDSIWYYPDTMQIFWGDTEWLFTGYKDSVAVLNYLEHEYKTGGIYYLTVALKPKRGCKGFYSEEVRFSHAVFLKHTNRCPHDPVFFKDSVETLGSLIKWTPTNKLGTLFWDFGDGTKDTGYNMSHVFPGIGTYIITLNAVNDSGCGVIVKDTLVLSEPLAGIKVPPIVYCSEIKQYFDSSFMIQPNNGQTINEWFWDFADGSVISRVKNPVHIFPGGGLYQIKLKVKTNLGCEDSTTQSLFVLGPEVKAAIISDSSGCVPLQVKFTNLSKQTENYIWEFGDSNNTIYSTNRDTNTSFTYSKPGTYYAHLTGGGSFYNSTTGSWYYCSVRYPGPREKEIRIQVFETAFASFNAPAIICIYDSLRIENTSSNKDVNYLWKFGNGDFANRSLDTFYYKFNQPGKYTISLVPQLSMPTIPKCFDSAAKEVEVTLLQPDFRQECNLSRPSELILKNLSGVQIDGYQWTLLNPLDSSEIILSDKYDLIYDFGKQTGLKKICLGLSNGSACGGKVCKDVYVDGDVFLANVFTPGKDGFNDFFKVPIQNPKKFRLKIYNRWGELIFESDTPTKEWNGQVFNSGPDLPEGAYFYRLEFQAQCAEKENVVSGSITLIR